MTKYMVDTCIVIDLLKDIPKAVSWYEEENVLTISRLTWFEVMEGVFQPGLSSSQLKNDVRQATRLMSEFNIIDINYAIGEQASELYLQYKPAFQKISTGHCIIAATALHLGIPVYSRNYKHMSPLLGDQLIVPYSL